MNETNQNLLVEQARAGCRKAMERLLEVRYPELLSLARGILRNNDDAQDVVQEAALKIVLNLERLEDAAAFSYWSNTIVRRCCFRVLDRRNRIDSSSVAFDEERCAPDIRVNGSKRAEDGIRITELFQLLGEKPAEILRLRLLLGLSVQETAASLGVSEGAIKVRLHRARQKALQYA